MPNLSDLIRYVTLTATQTLTNKTLTSPTIDLSTVTSAGDLPVADGGTGASTAAGARTNIGLGTIATQDAGSVTITGGAIDATAIGQTTQATISGTTGQFNTSLNVDGLTTLDAVTVSGNVAVDTDTLFVDVSSDRAGINTASPDAPLHVVNAGTGWETLVLDNPTANDGNFIRFLHDDSPPLSPAEGYEIGAAANADAFVFRRNGVEQMRIDSNGRILIGTSTSGASTLRIVGLPTSAAGLSAGDVWNDAGTLKIV